MRWSQFILMFSEDLLFNFLAHVLERPSESQHVIQLWGELLGLDVHLL